MAFELRVAGRAAVSFDTEDEAVAAVRAMLADDPDAEPEVFDVATGKACAPGASKSWREHLRTQVGF